MPSVPDLHFEAVEGLVRVLPLLVAIPRILTSREAVNTHESSPQCSLLKLPGPGPGPFVRGLDPAP